MLEGDWRDITTGPVAAENYGRMDCNLATRKTGWFVDQEERRRNVELAQNLERRLNGFLLEAHSHVMPQGTLEAGMGFRTEVDQKGAYDESKDEVTVTGTVTIRVRHGGFITPR